jgi:hypothetical protein
MDDWGNWRLNCSGMNTNHFVRHPKLSRDQLNSKRLAIIYPDGSTYCGYLTAGDARHDNRYVLMFNQDAIPSSSVQGGAVIKTPEVTHTVFGYTGIQSLDQFTVDRIRSCEANDPIENCKLVCEMPSPINS